jgi:UDP-N-acetylmuramoylalanine--D-glutamate ligase
VIKLNYASKKTAVIGLAVSNTPLIRYLIQQKALVTVFDKKPVEELKEYLIRLSDLKYNSHFGGDYLTFLHGFDYIFVTPGMKKDLPEFQEERARGAIFSSEMEIFIRNCPATMVGITGSSGKTTTTTLTGEMVASQFPGTFVGGNIGRSLMEKLPEMTGDSKVILELSSFQLQELKQSPHIAVITNVTPNHLDMHASMEEYIDAKANILRFQQKNDITVLNYDNAVTRDLQSLVQGKLYFFSRLSHLEEGAYLDGNRLIVNLGRQPEVFACKEQLKLLGDHNVENILTAALVGRIMGVPIEILSEVAGRFTGVEHRLELVRELNGIKFYNDSISTTPDRAIAGLKAMTQPTILIAGGYDKHLPFETLAVEIVKTCKQLLVLGVTAPQIISAVRVVDPDFPITPVKTLEEAVAITFASAVSGDAVLLSPACASYDMFKNYQERGLLFKKLVAGIHPAGGTA